MQQQQRPPHTRPSVFSWVQLGLLSVVMLACGGQPQTIAAQTRHVAPTPQNITLPAPNNDVLAQAEQSYLPVRLTMSRLHIDAPIIPVSTDANGAMLAPDDAPKESPIWNEVYWWNAGAYPGQTGNAVIAGHVNRPYPGPAPFTDLEKLVVGDTILIQTAGGATLTFVVTGTATPTAYAQGDSNPIIEQIFGPAVTPNLNLITCYGQYDGKTFDHRLVVYTRLEGVSPFPAPQDVVTP